MTLTELRAALNNLLPRNGLRTCHSSIVEPTASVTSATPTAMAVALSTRHRLNGAAGRSQARGPPKLRWFKWDEAAFEQAYCTVRPRYTSAPVFLPRTTAGAICGAAPNCQALE